jgi:hypothetical protein
MRQNVEVDLVNNSFDLWAVGEMQALARAIRGHPTVTNFDCCYNFPSEASHILYSALATLPALESMRLTSPSEDEIPLAIHVSLTELLHTFFAVSLFFQFLFRIRCL